MVERPRSSCWLRAIEGNRVDERRLAPARPSPPAARRGGDRLGTGRDRRGGGPRGDEADLPKAARRKSAPDMAARYARGRLARSTRPILEARGTPKPGASASGTCPSKGDGRCGGSFHAGRGSLPVSALASRRPPNWVAAMKTLIPRPAILGPALPGFEVSWRRSCGPPNHARDRAVPGVE
jgi:hypothetical protein